MKEQKLNPEQQKPFAESPTYLYFINSTDVDVRGGIFV